MVKVFTIALFVSGVSVLYSVNSPVFPISICYKIPHINQSSIPNMKLNLTAAQFIVQISSTLIHSKSDDQTIVLCNDVNQLHTLDVGTGKDYLKRHTLWGVVLLKSIKDRLCVCCVCVCAYLCVTSYGFPVIVSAGNQALVCS